ncbi:hypothetical protein CAPTEDRAFT_193113 [Capitella teleta]|uniref:G-protein coupled receptors family 1 profile domain-containing protein n=1 Tax=Capitella teleta TaxID=283909 RepID=R7UMH9_CAPTE|nr:hypothetical protein CAPTEDRAFT_193113 [Capitella teleta]|eukprot:ELU07744.1 hypothetical protein CAPTEDRAFT_193113 [Capitella teleta]
MSEATGNVSVNFTSGTVFVGSQNYWVYLVSVSSVNALMNFLLLIAILVTKLDRGSNRFIFIGDLAIGASVVGFSNTIEGCINLTNPSTSIQGNGCIALSILNMAGVHVGSLNLVTLVVDQYVLIAYPLRYQVVFRRKRACVLSVMIYTCVIGISASTALLWDTRVPCSYMHNLPMWHHSLTFFLVLVIPLLVVVILQVLTIRISRRHMRQIRNSGVCDSTSEESMLRRHWTGVITNTLICVALILTWTPLVICFGINFGFQDFKSNALSSFTYYAASSFQMYGIWLPLIYTLRSPQVKSLWSRLRARCKNKEQNALN